MDNTPYFMRGLFKATGTTAALASTSRYLNDARIRDWVSTHMLRRSEKDLPTHTDPYQLHLLLMEVQDLGRIEELFTEARRQWPDLDRWLSEKFISTYTRDDLLACPPGSLGAALGKYVVENNFELDIIARFEPKTQYDYYRIRSAQTHDLEHIVGGGGFDILGELVPYYIRLTNIFKFLPAELAGEVSVLQVFGSMRILARTALHYPQSWLAALATVQRGIRVGLESGPLFMAKYEDALHLPIAQARELLGVVGAVDVDTRAASHEWDEYK